MKKQFKIKVADKRTNRSLLVSIGVESLPLSVDAICKTVGSIGYSETDNLLTFIGNEGSALETEDIHNICKATKAILGDMLTWNIIGELPETEEIKELNAYIVINK